MNNMGSVLKPSLSVHQQNCCYSPSSPSPTRFQKHLAHHREHSGLRLPQLVGTEEVIPVSSTGQPDAVRKKALCLPFWDFLSLFISPVTQHRVGTQRQLWWKMDQSPLFSLPSAQERAGSPLPGHSCT